MMSTFLYNLATDKYKGTFAGILKIFLFILSIIYGLIIRSLIFLNRLWLHRLNCRVISVGNITLGGTGKTPLVEYIAKFLKNEGHKVAVITRGYKKSSKLKTKSLKLDGLNYRTMGDEAYMLSKKLEGIPLIMDRDRFRATARAINDYGVDTVIFDDGFQQWKIKKDLEIVTIDSNNPFGNRQMIPRGIMREPLSSLKRADIFVLAKAQDDTAALKSMLSKFNPQAQIFQFRYKPEGCYDLAYLKDLISIESLRGKSLSIFSGIADPDSFENIIRGLGVRISLSFKFADHYNYSQEDLDKIINQSQSKAVFAVITTEKDAVRLSGLRITDYGLRILFLRVALEIKDYANFDHRLHRLYSI